MPKLREIPRLNRNTSKKIEKGEDCCFRSVHINYPIAVLSFHFLIKKCSNQFKQTPYWRYITTRLIYSIQKFENKNLNPVLILNCKNTFGQSRFGQRITYSYSAFEMLASSRARARAPPFHKFTSSLGPRFKIHFLFTRYLDVCFFFFFFFKKLVGVEKDKAKRIRRKKGKNREKKTEWERENPFRFTYIRLYI